MRLFLLSFVLSIAVLSRIMAQENKMDSLTLEGAVITGRYNDNYLSSNVDPSLRLHENLIKIPQNIAIVTSGMMKDQMAFNINEDITRNVSGAFREELHNMISPDMYFRGAYVMPQLNGMDLRPLVKGPIAQDMSVVQSVEFVKGPSLFMNSMSDPGGAYNVVTKKNTGKTRRSAELVYGSWQYMRAAVDWEGAFDESKKWQYRFNLMGMSSNSFMQYAHNKRLTIAPVISYAPNETTLFTFEYLYTDMAYSLLSEAQISNKGFGVLPRSFAISDPAMRPFEAENHTFSLTYEKRYGSHWLHTVRVAHLFDDMNGSLFWADSISRTNPDTLLRYTAYNNYRYNIVSAQTYLRGEWVHPKVHHVFLGGIDFNAKRQENLDTWIQGGGIYFPLSFSRPQYGEVQPRFSNMDFDAINPVRDDDHTTDLRLWYLSGHGLYTASFFNDKLSIAAGGRLTYASGYTREYVPSTDAVRIAQVAFTPRMSVNYLIIPTLSVYALWDNSFLPRVGIDANNNRPLQPQEGRNLEIGVKKNFAKEKLTLTAAAYHIHRNNFISQSPTHVAFFEGGTNRTMGIEWDIRGQVLPGLDVVANYAWTDSKIITSDNKREVGTNTPNLVKHIHNAWLNYGLPRPLRGLHLFAGYRMLLDREYRYVPLKGDAPGTVRLREGGEDKRFDRLGNIFLLDLGASFVLSQYAVRFVVKNALDANYQPTGWINADDLYYWVVGAPVNFKLSVAIQL